MSAERPRRQHRGISSWAIRRPIGTITLATVAIVLGVFFLSRLPIDLLPTIVYPQVRASVSNPGVAPEVMEETVAKPLEAALATTEDLESIETEVQEGRAAVNLEFGYGTDMNFALQDASKNLDRARGSLPEEADPPTIFKFDPAQVPIYEVGFSSSSRDLIDLRDWVENRLRPRLLTIQGVASVDVSGGLEREIQIILDQERLRSYGLSVSEIIATLRAGNQDVAAGRIASSEREVVGKTVGKFQSVDQIRALPLGLAAGRRIPLTEVADVRDTNREQRLWARLDGVPAVKLSIRKQPDANTVAVADGVDRELRDLAESGFVPEDIEFQILENQADFIERSLASVRNAAILGAFLAMTVVLLFLGSLRKTFVIGTAIPLAILATFVMMGLGSLTLNIMTLGGLALGVGLLIDNSIVMLENIFRHREEGNEDPEAAAHHGAEEVQSAVIAATATNLAAVVPFLLISGLAALIFRELILTISFAIMASLAVALTLVPTLSALVAKVRFSSGIGRSRPLRAVDRGMGRARGLYRRYAPVAVRRRGLVLAGAILLLAGTWLLVRGQGSEFLPQVDDGNAGVFLRLPPGASAEETNRLALEVEEIVRGMPHVEHRFTTAGGFLFGGSTSERAGRGSMSISLVPASERDMSADEWVTELDQRIEERGFPGAGIFVRPPRIRGLRTSASGSQVAVSIQGDDLAELQRIGDTMIRTLEGIPGLENLEPSSEEASPQLSVELDRERATSLGLDVAEVGQTLRTALDGTIATRYTEGNREYDVRVMLPRERFTSPEDLQAVAMFPAGGNGGAAIYLRDIATVEAGLGPTSILREQQNRALRIEGDVLTDVASIGAVDDSIRARLAELELPDGYSIVIGGEAEAVRENNRQLMIVALLAVFLVFVVLAVQYESLINPLVILLVIPFSLIGVGVFIWVFGTPLSAPVLLGVILLAGIVVNNAILLVQYAERFRRDRGASLEAAVVEAGAVRLRPILMTTLTTVCGMLPLALGIGEGSELMQPLAVAVIGGLSFSAILTLIVLPGVYVLLNETGIRLHAWVTGSRAEVERVTAPAPLPAPEAAPALAPVGGGRGDRD
ncbi:MAG TPA: efflux RND transporter permease subunit [Gemmatimonadota bacterium]|nr:efflux RND transporter permease subunit [Gemmatimonadota bacterium]